MKRYEDYSDSRHYNGCVFCSKQPDSRDHVPARTFLNKPYPDNLPVLPICTACNNVSSLDEEYVSFLICYLKNLENDSLNERLNRFTHANALEARILSGLESDKNERSSVSSINIETGRVKKVLSKYAFAHFCFERGEHPEGEAIQVNFAFVNQLTDEQIRFFNKVPFSEIWPEVGNRLFQRMAEDNNSWIIVQDEWYRYYVSPDEPYVRIVINEFLFSEIVFSKMI